MSELWLVRTPKNQISGPFSKGEVCEQIKSGGLRREDEVCSGSGYWFTLNESQEVRKWLGVDPPLAPLPSGEEITATGSDTARDLTAPSIEVPQDFAGETEQHTQVLQVKPLSSAVRSHPVPPSSGFRRSAPPNSAPRNNPVFLPPIERPSIFRGLAWGLGLAFLIVLYVVLKFLKNPALTPGGGP